jgi:hypothetical protein
MKTKTQSVKPGDLFRNTLNGDIYYIIHFAVGIAPTPCFLARRLVFDEKNKKATFNKRLVFISLENFESRKISKRVIKKIPAKEYRSWPSWRKHLDQVPEALADLDQLAISFSKLDYKALCHFLFMLSVCISKKAKEDKRRKKPHLAFNLENTSSYLLASGQYSFLASMICEKKKDLP